MKSSVPPDVPRKDEPVLVVSFGDLQRDPRRTQNAACLEKGCRDPGNNLEQLIVGMRSQEGQNPCEVMEGEERLQGPFAVPRATCSGKRCLFLG